MRVLFSVEEAWDAEFVKSPHHLLEAKEGVTFGYSSEVLTVLVSETVEDEGCEFVHALAVVEPWVCLQEDVNNASQAIIVIGFLPKKR